MSKVTFGEEAMLDAESYGWEEWFEEVIKAGVVKRPRAKGIHYSDVSKHELGYNKEPLFCYRQCTLAACGYDVSETIHKPETLWNFELGWRIHEAIQQILKNAGYAVEVETSHLAKQWRMAFTPDGIIERNNRKYVLEAKGYNNKKFDKDVAAGRPDLDAHRQCNAYMGLLGTEYHQGVILEICKGKSETGKFFQIWEVSYDELMTHEIVMRLNTIQRMAALHEKYHGDLKVLPDRLPNCKTKASTRAKECSMRDACFARNTLMLQKMRTT